MTSELDPYKLASPQRYLWRMLIFIGAAAFIPLILYRQILEAFWSNPLLNAMIFFVLAVGIFLAMRQVVRLFREVKWVNNFRLGDPGLEVSRPPILLAPMATLLGDRVGRMAINTSTMRSILESVGMRLDEARDISRYLTGLLVFLGLLGTFWGLLQTVSSVGDVIRSLSVASTDVGVIFEDLKAGLEAPLKGMGTAFSSSLFGLSGSLVLGFLDLQAGQAQTRFFTNLEDWLSTVTDIRVEDLEAGYGEALGNGNNQQLVSVLEQLSRKIDGVNADGSANSGRTATTAMANLAEGIQGLVQHLRSEQQLMREWADQQSTQQEEIKQVLTKLNTVLSSADSSSENK
ncbi:flagellar motor protein MotA [Cohaesibacter celericrescens]|uniref:Flagellar motor protein MotA n=1 Tax=Cohaesibacter celericrescens TaxID=2067669 RepID=A0A2N5XLI7_9HYPH|nr:flagellar motor protein MotA [Cohaesibacter celericrescens]PLW75298.1 flagellar motor protein MotA [Cohaesibacter celericrescens]